MNKSLTIVLPVHNGEARLRRHVGEVLELAAELTDHFSILIVDDGSTDDTYDVAGQLAATYPQISVMRHGRRRGLGPAIKSIRRRVKSDLVIVHDGVTRLDLNQVRKVWYECAQPSETAPHLASGNGRGSIARELADLSEVHGAMARAHDRLTGFFVLEDTGADAPTASNRDEHGQESVGATEGGEGIGRIPPLPRPDLFSAVADFALGE